jgi:hypothetical protein
MWGRLGGLFSYAFNFSNLSNFSSPVFSTKIQLIKVSASVLFPRVKIIAQFSESAQSIRMMPHT